MDQQTYALPVATRAATASSAICAAASLREFTYFPVAKKYDLQCTQGP